MEIGIEQRTEAVDEDDLNVKRLPNINPFAFKVIQPLKGATAATCPAAPL